MNSTYYALLATNKDLGATRGIDAALKAHNLDALVLPAPGFTTVPAGEHQEAMGMMDVLNILTP